MVLQVIRALQKKRFMKKCKALPLHDFPLHHAKGIDYYNMQGHAYIMMTMIKLPKYSRVLRLISQSLLLALVFVTLPILRTTLVPSQFFSATSLSGKMGPDHSSPMNFHLLSLVFRDLTNEGLLKAGDKALIVSNNGDRDEQSNAIHDSHLFNVNDINIDLDVVSSSDLERQNLVADQSIDLILALGFHKEFVDRTLKVGGIMVVQLDGNPFFQINKPSNYKVAYFRRFESSILALRKTTESSTGSNTNWATQRRLLGYSPEERKAALKNLEDVLLEPPRAASGKSRTYLKKTRYLPDLTGDTLESYPRRVFIDVGLPEREGGSGTGWFKENYPTRNLEFDMYKIETVTEESSGKEVLAAEGKRDDVDGGMSEWLRKNVKEEEYVVVKAEAEVVEEVVKGKAISLVDELFLECKPKGHTTMRSKYRRSRAYWECLALYGKLRDEGVAVHQWWG